MCWLSFVICDSCAVFLLLACLPSECRVHEARRHESLARQPAGLCGGVVTLPGPCGYPSCCSHACLVSVVSTRRVGMRAREDDSVRRSLVTCRTLRRRSPLNYSDWSLRLSGEAVWRRSWSDASQLAERSSLLQHGLRLYSHWRSQGT